MGTDVHALISPILELHHAMRKAILAAFRVQEAGPALSGVARDGEGDTIYYIDRISEEQLIEQVERISRAVGPLVLVAEGLPHGGEMVLPRGAEERNAAWRLIVDPIDGTRGLMYQKRSAWILSAVAPNRGSETSLADIVFAVQTEVPVIKQHLADQIWGLRDGEVHAVRQNLLDETVRPLELAPSSARSIAHGFATVSRFFPGARDLLAAIDDEIALGALGPISPGKAHCFEDQYISTGGQLYELMAGHDRFVADLRPLTEKWLARRGMALGLCCHPYDICTSMIAQKLGVIVTAPDGAPLDAPLDVGTEVAWVGYANSAIRAEVEPLLQAALHRRGLI